MADNVSDGRPEYMIKRGFRSSIRLNYNHLLMKEVAGGLLHPSISVKQERLRIADVGAGTAAWALEAAVKFPEAQVDAFDISDKQYSHLYGVRNVKLIVHDCFETFPQEYHRQYDIVHARFWLCLVNNPDAPTLLQNLMTLLKPGGYLQWFEPLPLLIEVSKADPSMSTPFMDQLRRSWQKPREDSTCDWVEQLSDTFSAHGLLDVVSTKHKMGDQFLAMWMQSNLAGLEDTVDENIHNIGKAEAIKKFSVALQGEIKRGVALRTPFTWVVGQKPVSSDA